MDEEAHPKGTWPFPGPPDARPDRPTGAHISAAAPRNGTRSVLEAMELAAKALNISRGELVAKLKYFSPGTKTYDSSGAGRRRRPFSGDPVGLAGDVGCVVTLSVPWYAGRLARLHRRPRGVSRSSCVS